MTSARKPARHARRMIESTIDKGRQSVVARQILEVEGFRIRLIVESDAYAFQSSARAEVWSKAELRWNTVHTIHHAAMKTNPGLVYGREPVAADFAADMAELLSKAEAIIL